MNQNAESLYLCGLPAFVLLIGPSLALFVEKVIAGLRRIYTEHFIKNDIKIKFGFNIQ